MCVFHISSMCFPTFKGLQEGTSPEIAPFVSADRLFWRFFADGARWIERWPWRIWRFFPPTPSQIKSCSRRRCVLRTRWKQDMENRCFLVGNWLVIWNMNFIFHFIYGIILPVDEHIFFKIVKTTNQGK